MEAAEGRARECRGDERQTQTGVVEVGAQTAGRCGLEEACASLGVHGRADQGDRAPVHRYVR